MAPKRAAAAAPAAPAIKVRANALKGEKCIITGDIEGMKRKEAEQILINAGATIEKSLNKSVTMAVLGAKAGPSKLEKIEELGINSPTWEEVMDDIRDDGGEDGDDEPAAAEEDKMDEDKDEDDDDEEEEEEEEASSSILTSSLHLPVQTNMNIS
jgi:BRCT domain type II-containing protein